MTPSKRYHRRSIRWPNYDYTQPGAYFVTLCTHQRAALFGAVAAGEMRLNDYGRFVHAEWLKSAQIRQEVELDEFVLMPNHLHGIVWLVPSDVPSKKQASPSDDTSENRTNLQNNVGASGNTPGNRTHRQNNVGACGRTPLPPGLTPKSLGACINGFKSSVTAQINRLRDSPGQPVWQRNYYEHVIRNDKALTAIRRYIQQNPQRWTMDRYNPEMTTPDPQAKALWQLLKSQD